MFMWQTLEGYARWLRLREIPGHINACLRSLTRKARFSGAWSPTMPLVNLSSSFSCHPCQHQWNSRIWRGHISIIYSFIDYWMMRHICIYIYIHTCCVFFYCLSYFHAKWHGEYLITMMPICHSDKSSLAFGLDALVGAFSATDDANVDGWIRNNWSWSASTKWKPSWEPRNFHNENHMLSSLPLLVEGTPIAQCIYRERERGK